MTVKITTPNGGADSLDFGCAQTAIVATVTGTEVSSGEGKLEFKTTTSGTSATKMTINGAGLATFTGATTTAGTVTASGDMKFNSGYGSAVTAYGCRAWVNFNGSGTVSINDHGNVSSITDNGTGDYTVNFAVDMPDANFAVAGLSKSADTGGIRGAFMSLVANSTATATGYVRVTTQYDNTNVRDSNPVTVAIFR